MLTSSFITANIEKVVDGKYTSEKTTMEVIDRTTNIYKWKHEPASSNKSNLFDVQLQFTTDNGHFVGPEWIDFDPSHVCGLWRPDQWFSNCPIVMDVADNQYYVLIKNNECFTKVVKFNEFTTH